MPIISNMIILRFFARDEKVNPVRALYAEVGIITVRFDRLANPINHGWIMGSWATVFVRRDKLQNLRVCCAAFAPGRVDPCSEWRDAELANRVA